MKMLKYKGMTFAQKKDGTYAVTSDNGLYKDICATFYEATM